MKFLNILSYGFFIVAIGVMIYSLVLWLKLSSGGWTPRSPSSELPKASPGFGTVVKLWLSSLTLLLLSVTLRRIKFSNED